jgi:hypothetical protein
VNISLQPWWSHMERDKILPLITSLLSTSSLLSVLIVFLP